MDNENAEPPHLEFDLLISKDKIDEKITSFAKQVEEDFQGQELMIIMIMKGAVCFAADLIRSIHLKCSLDFLYCSSYGMAGTERQELKIVGIDQLDITNKHVLVVDDIFDSGNTLTTVLEKLKDKNPQTLKSMVLLSRKVERVHDYTPNYVLFEIDSDAFVVGYGLDYKEHYRGLPGIFVMKDGGEEMKIQNEK